MVLALVAAGFINFSLQQREVQQKHGEYLSGSILLFPCSHIGIVENSKCVKRKTKR